MSELHTAVECFCRGDLNAANELCSQVIKDSPNDARALHLTGMIRRAMGRHRESLRILRRAIELDPSRAEYRNNLGAVLMEGNFAAEAANQFREAVRLEPQLMEARRNLARALRAARRPDEAIEVLRETLHCEPEDARTHQQLGELLRDRRQPGEAIVHLRRVVEIHRDSPEGWNSLALGYRALSRAVEAAGCYRRAVDLHPVWPDVHSNLVFVMHYDPDCTPQQMYEEHLRWAERNAAPLYAEQRPHDNDPNPDRRLRIGYLSSQLRSHPVARFIEPALAHHDTNHFDVTCYSSVEQEDGITRRLRDIGHAWKNVRRFSDAQLAELVRRDRIDILIDLDGHMGGHRLLTFARKPAPVQVTYLGYPDTTGLSSIDYRITDSIHDPPGMTERYHAEKLVRLDSCCWCYRPQDGAPEVNELPAGKDTGGQAARGTTRGVVTFAALNRPVKITERMLSLWARILTALPESRLMLLWEADDFEGSWIWKQLAAAGIARGRIEVIGRLKRGAYMRQYLSADIALDTFPYTGHTTTCDALWMGVPTVSMFGQTHHSRAGLDVLSQVGLEELAAESEEEYVRIAVPLAGDLPRVADLRRSLRQRMQRSSLRDEAGFTLRLEEALRGMWREWCEPAATPEPFVLGVLGAVAVPGRPCDTASGGAGQ